MLDAYLRGPEDVTRGMERHAHAVHVHRLAPVDGADVLRGAKTRAQYRLAFARAEISLRAPPRVITVAMRDDRAFHGLPRVDVEVAVGTIQALGTLNDEVGVH